MGLRAYTYMLVQRICTKALLVVVVVVTMRSTHQLAAGDVTEGAPPLPPSCYGTLRCNPAVTLCVIDT